MRIISWEKAPKAAYQEYIAVVEHEPSWLARVFLKAMPEQVTYRGRGAFWHRADTGRLITAADWGRDYAAKQMLVDAFTRMEWAALDGRPVKEGLKTP